MVSIASEALVPPTHMSTPPSSSPRKRASLSTLSSRRALVTLAECSGQFIGAKTIFLKSQRKRGASLFSRIRDSRLLCTVSRRLEQASESSISAGISRQTGEKTWLAKSASEDRGQECRVGCGHQSLRPGWILALGPTTRGGGHEDCQKARPCRFLDVRGYLLHVGIATSSSTNRDTDANRARLQSLCAQPAPEPAVQRRAGYATIANQVRAGDSPSNHQAPRGRSEWIFPAKPAPGQLRCLRGRSSTEERSRRRGTRPSVNRAADGVWRALPRAESIASGADG